MLLNLEWAIPSRLARGSKPSSPEDVALLVIIGIGAVVSLEITNDVVDAALSEAGIERLFFPMEDDVDPDLYDLGVVEAFVRRMNEGGKAVYVHCSAGIRRTGHVVRRLVEMHLSDDVPSPINFRLMADARAWEQSAMSKRPWRMEFFECFASEIAVTTPRVHRVLELGSGPGFLAEYLLRSLQDIELNLLDFSAAMHQLARTRLGELAERAQFVERSFKHRNWAEALGQFDCVVTNQAVHELRHKRYAPALHGQVRQVLSPDGVYLVCDHFVGEGGMTNDELYMSVAEHRQALLDAGFSSVHQVMLKGGLVLHRAM